MVFLEISQNSQENTCTRTSLLIELHLSHLSGIYRTHLFYNLLISLTPTHFEKLSRVISAKLTNIDMDA